MKDLVLRLRDLHERFIFQGGSQFANELADEIVSLREANERFCKRQEWWNEKMFGLEQVSELLQLVAKQRAEIEQRAEALSQTARRKRKDVQQQVRQRAKDSI